MGLTSLRGQCQAHSSRRLRQRGAEAERTVGGRPPQPPADPWSAALLARLLFTWTGRGARKPWMQGSWCLRRNEQSPSLRAIRERRSTEWCPVLLLKVACAISLHTCSPSPAMHWHPVMRQVSRLLLPRHSNIACRGADELIPGQMCSSGHTESPLILKQASMLCICCGQLMSCAAARPAREQYFCWLSVP